MRKEKKYHFIYKTTNLLSGRYYIGMHSTNNLEDGYLGSGYLISRAIKKHGKENFVREILEFCNSREELKSREKEIVDLREIAKEECMNLQVGGGGGFISEEHRIKCTKASNKAFKEKYENDPEFRKHMLELSRKGLEKAKESDKTVIKGGKNPYHKWLGSTHTIETKDKMSKAKKGKYDGENNPVYGKCWVTKDKENKMVYESEIPLYESDGWIKGRFNPSKFDDETIFKIKEMYHSGVSCINISKLLDINRTTIYNILGR